MAMAGLISSETEFSKCKFDIYSRFKENVEIQHNPFNSTFQYFIAFDFDFLFDTSFFSGIKKFAKNTAGKHFTVYTINPSPISYFFARYGSYSVFNIGLSAFDDEFNDILMKNPVHNIPDSIAISSNDLAWFSDSKSWAILGSRDLEIAIIGFTSEELINCFKGYFNKESQVLFSSVEKFIIETLSSSLLTNTILKLHYDEILSSYQ